MSWDRQRLVWTMEPWTKLMKKVFWICYLPGPTHRSQWTEFWNTSSLGRLSMKFFLKTINSKILMFRDDIIEECGWEDKQHSWAAIEKPEEIFLYGPYYPNYRNGEHSEDTIIKQTQELIESVDGWLVFIFTLNRFPCLARNSEPCMLNLVWKAFEWYTQYGVKTHIGYKKCWGFKGTKENLFRDINYPHFEYICQSGNYQSYLKTIQESTESDQSPVCENIYSAIRKLLGPKALNIKFPLIITMQEQDRKMYFKKMSSISNSDMQGKKDFLAQEMSTMLEALASSLSDETYSLHEHLQKGATFTLDCSFNSQICDTMRAMMRTSFEQCWRDMVQDKFAEFLREMLIENFSKCTVQLFIHEITAVTKHYLHIGRIQLADDKASPKS
ncbi:uncharacterized protein LOC124469217 [Hypomesus transpacificus]|uniref:uncharacterized protein LOC124469217 n=1 Tax=Hypomesus transpacificus TaxID=137520 RepID=UPI001F072B2D|nr:uncharacterized protein LOC124469217 [Hypomesus transpacificus]